MSGKASDKALLGRTEASRQADELAAFRRMLAVSEGTFSLSFAVYNVRSLRDELVEQLGREFPGNHIVRVPVSTTDVYAVAKQQIGDASPTSIFVLDLEHALNGDHGADMLRALNASRELWEELRCPVIFWLAELAAAHVASEATDFWRYRSHIFEFAAPMFSADELQGEQFPGYEMIHGLPYDQKRFRRAELQQRIEEIGPSPSTALLPHVLSWMYELAELHKVCNDWSKAESLLRKALELSLQAYGNRSRLSATAMSNLAQFLKATNQLSEAEQFMRRALEIDTESLGENHPEVATDLNNLAQLFHITNRLTEAEPLMRRALEIDEDTLGFDHPHVASDLNNLAQLLRATNRLAEAEPLMQRALNIDEEHLGRDHPAVARNLNNLALLFHATNRMEDAEQFLRRALKIDEQSFGSNHPNVARTLNNLAQLLDDTGRPEEAEPLFRRALKIQSVVHGPSHPSTTIIQQNYQRHSERRKNSTDEIDRRGDVIEQADGSA